MNAFHAIVLSIIEGITEFLPISSTGHLILANSLLHIPDTDFVKTFDIWIQLGAILAVALLYAKKLLVDKSVLIRVGAAFLPTAVIGFALYKIIKHYLLGNPWIVVITLALGGLILVAVELVHKENESAKQTIGEMSLRQAVIVGLAQSLSVVPGVSRAAATIVGGQLTGLSRRAAVEFSFLLAIPTMIAASGLDLVKSNAFSFSPTQLSFLTIGFVGSCVTALFVVKLFLQFIQKNTFIPFGIYRILIAFLFIFFVLR